MKKIKLVLTYIGIAIIILTTTGCFPQGGSSSLMEPTNTPIPPTITSTNTPIPPTPTNTNTPRPPTPTAINTLMPGWTLFDGAEMALALPDSYLGGNLDEDIDFMIDSMRKLGPEYEQVANLIELYPDLFVLFATDSNLGDTGFLTSVNVTREKVLSTLSIDMYMELSEKYFPTGYTIVDREIKKIGNYESGVLISEINIQGYPMTSKQIQYIIKEDQTMWVITYTTEISEFETRLDDFEKSIGTFRLK